MTDFKIDYNFLLDVSKGMREYYGVDKILFDFDELRDAGLVVIHKCRFDKEKNLWAKSFTSYEYCELQGMVKYGKGNS